MTARRSSRRRGSSPVTNKLLFEAGLSSLNSRWGGQAPAGALLDFIPVVELVAHPGGGVPRAVLRVSRALELLRQSLRPRSAAQRVAGLALVRHGRAQPEGRLSGRLSPSRSRHGHSVTSGHRELPLLRRLPDLADPADQRPARGATASATTASTCRISGRGSG